MDDLLKKYNNQVEKVFSMAKDYFQDESTTAEDKQDIINSLKDLQANIKKKIEEVEAKRND